MSYKVKIRIERTYNFSAIIIHIGMWLYAILRFKKPIKTYNHALIIYEDNCWESIAKGVVKHSVLEHLKRFENRKYEYLEKEIFLTKYQLDQMVVYLNYQVSKKYEFSNFLFHFIKILKNKWIGSKSDKKFNCYELVIRALNRTRKFKLDPFLNPYEFYKIMFKNV